jgi:ABC-type Na+ transport system ATPase subunit NatA
MEDNQKQIPEAWQISQIMNVLQCRESTRFPGMAETYIIGRATFNPNSETFLSEPHSTLDCLTHTLEAILSNLRAEFRLILGSKSLEEYESKRVTLINEQSIDLDKIKFN